MSNELKFIAYFQRVYLISRRFTLKRQTATSNAENNQAIYYSINLSKNKTTVHINPKACVSARKKHPNKYFQFMKHQKNYTARQTIFFHIKRRKSWKGRGGLHIFSFLIYKAPISMLSHMTGRTENRTRGGNKQLMCSISWMDGDNGNTVSGC